MLVWVGEKKKVVGEIEKNGMMKSVNKTPENSTQIRGVSEERTAQKSLRG